MTGVGQSAPDFRTRNQHGESVSLENLRGAPAVIIFYPWVFSGICGSELTTLRDDHHQFVEQGIRVLGVSCDAMFSLRAYADSERLPFDLLTDHWPHGAIARAYGIFDERAGCALRASFVVDADGVISWRVVNGIGEPRDLADLLAALPA